MRLPWRRHKHDQPEPSAADEALKISERQRERAAERGQEFSRLANRMRRMRATNHLAEAFKDAFGEGR